ncbi:MAG: ImmA/IrrE family metallo-endopeptidase [Gemmatimonadaceae bacterium]
MRSTIATLRDMVPLRPLTLPEALRVADLQASRLLELTGVTEPPVPEAIITELPRVQVERMKLAGISGAAEWSHGRWLILINGSDVPGRQRFSLLHEFKHVLDNPFISLLYPDAPGTSSHDRGEQACDYFAGCVLVPRPWLKRAWATGLQDEAALAERFGASRAAIRTRLLQTGLSGPASRCAPRRSYQRQQAGVLAWAA